MKYRHICAEVFNKPWAILPEKLGIIAELIALRAAGEKLTEEQIRERIGAGPRSSPSAPGVVAMIPICGVISNRMNMMSQISGGTSVEKLTSLFRSALADTNVKAIVFDVDSPGGSVEGVPELADEIYAARGKKKMVAVANTMAASAAYWLASCADELVVTPSGAVGSIGVFATHEDLSKALDADGVKMSLVSAGKYKVEGNPYEPLSDEARANLQSQVDAFYSMFTKAVARNRDATTSAVQNGFGQGRMVLAADAVKEGMADKVATMAQTLARFGVASGSSAPPRQVAGASRASLERELELHK
jgi:signal peptide peptidase SppA